MIFNKNNNGSRELRELTGNYYATNDFSKITGEINAATDEITELISQPVYATIEEYYKSDNSDKADIIRKLQRPIALLATLRLYQKNDLSHEDSGRKVKLDQDNEKLPWQWQLDRDDAIHLEEYYKAVDILIRALNSSDILQWKSSKAYKQSQQLIIRNGESFESYFPIQRSERTYLLLVPFIREVQRLQVERAYGAGWSALLTEDNDDETDAHYAACKAVALLAMSTALRRNQLQLIPAGVIRTYVAESGAMNSTPATLADIRLLAEWMADDAATWIDEMKRARDGATVERNIMPNNDPRNKFMRL